MKSFDCPTVMWVPVPTGTAHVYSGSRTRKAPTRTVINNYLLGHNPDEILMRLGINAKEFAVAVLYELKHRDRRIKNCEQFRQDIIDWATFAVEQMRYHEPVSWPPPSVQDFKKANK